MTAKSAALFGRAQAVIPGGVNSPVRAFGSVGGTPVYVTSGQGGRMTTVDGQELLDFCGSWGPLILGHAQKEVIDAIQSASAKGTSFGTNTPGEVAFAELVCDLVPAIDMVRLVNSGTEAVMTAIRIARGATGRDKIIKFEGCYHGHTDYMLVAAGSGLLTGGVSSSAGVSASAASEVMLSPYNDLDSVNKIVEAHGQDLAAIIVEPVAGNMGLVQPAEGFLQGLREAADRCGAVLIFDEVINGFRLAATTYGETIGVTPDLTTLGKIIGGGMPIGAVGGKRELMEHLAPLGKVYQAGTLSGNPIAVAVGLVTLKRLKETNPYPCLAELGKALADGVNEAAKLKGVAMHCAQLGGMFTPFFRKEEVTCLTDAKACDTDAHASFFHGMLKRGVYLPPSQFEVGFLSAAHTAEDVKTFVAAASESLDEIGKG